MRKRAHLLILVSLALEVELVFVVVSRRKRLLRRCCAHSRSAARHDQFLRNRRFFRFPPRKSEKRRNPEPPNIPPEKIVTPPVREAPPSGTRGRATPPRATTGPTGAGTASSNAKARADLHAGNKRNEYNRALDDSLDRVRKVLAAVQNRTLTDAQTEIVNRIRAFEKQAVQSREVDLVVATASRIAPMSWRATWRLSFNDYVVRRVVSEARP